MKETLDSFMLIQNKQFSCQCFTDSNMKGKYCNYKKFIITRFLQMITNYELCIN